MTGAERAQGRIAGAARRVTRWATPVCAVIAFVMVAPPVATASAAPLLPANDPFYTYSGSTPLARIAPGTILKRRTIAVAETDSAGPPSVSTPLSATQLLYRSTGEEGQPTAAVATVIHPVAPLAPGKIVSWQEAYDGLGGECDPSYALEGGAPTTDTNAIEEQPILALAAAGYTVVTPDYEGTGNQWLDGQEEGYDTLDGIRATENLLGLAPAATKVGILGYSGGSVPTNYAAELAPTYAPRLDIVGAAFGGIPVDLAHTLAYIDGSASWGDVIAGSLLGAARGFGLDLDPYLSPYGLTLVDEDAGACINTFASPPDITYQKLVKPQYQNIFTVSAFVRIFNHLTMGNSGTPKEPLYMGGGDSDGTGDGVMILADEQALAHGYCQRGVPVSFNVYKGEDHAEAIPQFFAGAVAFLIGRFDGDAVQNGCGAIPAGNSLAPLPVPASPRAARPRPTRHHHRARRRHPA